MAKKQKNPSAQQGKRPRQTAKQSAQPSNPRQRNSAAEQPRKKKAAASQQPTRTNRDAAKEAATPGSIFWRLALILCVGLVIFSLLFASINGGSKYVGITYETEKETTTPTPPVSSIDPNVNISGSDITPIPPSPTPGIDQPAEGGDIQTDTPQ